MQVLKMWRFRYIQDHLNSKVLRFSKDCHKIKCCRKCYDRFFATDASPTKTSSGPQKVLFGLVGVSLCVGGGAVAYAKYDPKFRSQIENTIPYADIAFGYLFGNPTEKEKELSVKPSQTKGLHQKSPDAANTGLIHKKLERDAAKKRVQETEGKPSDVPPVVSSSELQSSSQQQPTGAQTHSTSQQGLPDSKASVAGVTTLDASMQQRAASQDAVNAVENSALEVLTEDSIKDLSKALSIAISHYKKAVDAVQAYTASLQQALDASPGESVNANWDAVCATAAKQDSDIVEASDSGLKVRKCVENLKTIIQEGKKSKLTTTNPVLIKAEEALSNALYELQKSESEVVHAQSDAKILSEYKNLVEKGKEQFQKEIKDLLPDVKVGEKGKKLSEEELNYLIAHAYRKVDHLNKQLSAQQAGERARVQRALDIQKQEGEKLAETNLNVELDRLQRELQIAYQKKLNDINEEFEQELLQQLRRQAAAHSEHLRDVLNLQKKDLIVEYNRHLEDKLGDARHEFQQELAGSLGRLKGIDSALQSRSEVDHNIHKAQRLRVACQALQHSVEIGQGNTKTWEEQRKPLNDEVTAISSTAGKDDKFVQAVIGAIPQDALHHGVFTKEALKDRFFRVDEVCRQVAMIDDRGGNLVKYALSYLQSLLVFADLHIPVAELADEPTDFSQLNTFNILDRARWCVDRDNFEQALRYMNLLRGLPKKVAADWLKETRMMLEIKQAADVLLTQAEAMETTGIIQ